MENGYTNYNNSDDAINDIAAKSDKQIHQNSNFYLKMIASGEEISTPQMVLLAKSRLNQPMPS